MNASLQDRTGMRRPRVLIADDHALLAEGIASVLRPTCDIAGFCSDGRQMIELAASLSPDIIVFDIGMPGLNGLEAARRVHLLYPSILLVCITQQVTLPYLRAAFDAGANAFVSKQAALTELEEAVAKAVGKRQFVTASLREAFEEVRLEWKTTLRPVERSLTQRQREVLQLIAEGRQNKEIATTLQVSSKTVEYHRSAIMKVLGLRSVAELTRYAISRGLTTVPQPTT